MLFVLTKERKKSIQGFIPAEVSHKKKIYSVLRESTTSLQWNQYFFTDSAIPTREWISNGHFLRCPEICRKNYTHNSAEVKICKLEMDILVIYFMKQKLKPFSLLES